MGWGCWRVLWGRFWRGFRVGYGVRGMKGLLGDGITGFFMI
jgi:hypothetical protein